MKRLKPSFATEIFFSKSGYLCIRQEGKSIVSLSPEQTKNLREFISGSYFEQQNLWRADDSEGNQ